MGRAVKNSLKIIIKQVRLEGGFERGSRIRRSTDLWSVPAFQKGDMLYLHCAITDLWSVLALPKGPGYASCSVLCQYLWHRLCRQRDQWHACTESAQQITRCPLTRGARGAWQPLFLCTRNTIAFPEPDKRRRVGAQYVV